MENKIKCNMPVDKIYFDKDNKKIPKGWIPLTKDLAKGRYSGDIKGMYYNPKGSSTGESAITYFGEPIVEKKPEVKITPVKQEIVKQDLKPTGTVKSPTDVSIKLEKRGGKFAVDFFDVDEKNNLISKTELFVRPAPKRSPGSSRRSHSPGRARRRPGRRPSETANFSVSTPRQRAWKPQMINMLPTKSVWASKLAPAIFTPGKASAHAIAPSKKRVNPGIMKSHCGVHSRKKRSVRQPSRTVRRCGACATRPSLCRVIGTSPIFAPPQLDLMIISVANSIPMQR